MVAKLAVVILSLGICGCTLLALRQARLQAASELVRVQLRVRAQDEKLWQLRTEIGRLVTPERVREMASSLGPMRPVNSPRPINHESVAPGVPLKPSRPSEQRRRQETQREASPRLAMENRR